MQEIVKGCAWVFGNDINSESIMPSGIDHDPHVAAKMCLEFYDPDFAPNAKPGDFVIAGTNFGNSSSRPAANTFLAMGISAAICESSSVIFFRNSWNLGFPVFHCKGITNMVKKGDEIEVNLVTGYIKNLTTGEDTQAEKPIDTLVDRWRSGGMFSWLRERKDQIDGLE